MSDDNIFEPGGREDAAWERRISEALRSVPVNLDPAVVAATQARVAARARELRQRRDQLRPLWILLPLSLLWMVLTTPYAWMSFEWLGHRFALAGVVWRGAFLVWWFLPAVALALVLVLRSHEEARST